MKITKPNDFTRVKQATSRDLIQPAAPLPVLIINPPVIIPVTNVIDWSAGNIHTQDVDINKTYTFGTMTDGQTILVKLKNIIPSLAFTLTWPVAVKGAETSIPANMTKLFSFTKIGNDIFATQVEIA